MASKPASMNVDAEAMRDIKLRPLVCNLNPLSCADGSALLAHGDTCVLASIVGPIEVKLQKLIVDKTYLECAFRSKTGIPTIKDRYREHVIKSTCEAALLGVMHPRTKISIQVQALDDRCGLEACAINAACLAMLVGGAPMEYTFAAVHCILDKNGQLLLDPDNCQEIGRIAAFLFVFDSLESNIVTVFTRGQFNTAQYNDAEVMCRAASGTIFKYYRDEMAKFYKHSISNVDESQTECTVATKMMEMEVN